MTDLDEAQRRVLDSAIAESLRQAERGETAPADDILGRLGRVERCGSFTVAVLLVGEKLSDADPTVGPRSCERNRSLVEQTNEVWGSAVDDALALTTLGRTSAGRG